MKVKEFEEILSRLTLRELNVIQEGLYMKFGSSPVWDTGGTKPHNIRNFTYWVKGNPERITNVLELVNKRVSEKEMAPVRGPVPHTKYIAWSEFTSLKSYKLIEPAVFYSHDYKRKSSPMTRDGYVSVDAIFNMSAWASWKSSSLSATDRQIANAIEQLNLLGLMELNKGRRADQPALFPVGMIK